MAQSVRYKSYPVYSDTIASGEHGPEKTGSSPGLVLRPRQVLLQKLPNVPEVIMGLGDLTPSDTEESSSGGQSTYVTFKNPRSVDVDEGQAHRHQQEYYDAIQSLRNMLGQDLNVPIGEFAAAVVEVEQDGDSSRLEELFNTITN